MTWRPEHDSTPDTAISEAELQAALEHKPDVTIPADFAARVAAQATQFYPSRMRRVPRYARLTALVVAFVVAVSLFALAPRTTASFGNLAFDLELLALLQMGLLAWWFMRQPSRGL